MLYFSNVLKTFFWFTVFWMLHAPVQAQQTYTGVDAHAQSIDLRGHDIEQLTDTLTAPFSTELEKVRAIFTWITANIRYDCGEQNRVETEPEDVVHPLYFTQMRLENIFRTRRTQCEGYALLFKTMTNLAGIRSTIIEGYARTGSGNNDPATLETNHAWNAVCIDGEWEVIDVTWASGSCAGRQFQAARQEQYFLMTPAQQRQRHEARYEAGQVRDSRIRY